MQNYFLKIKNFLERDWLDDIKKYYININPVYRHSFWILFIVTNIIFGYHTINFFWGNHDWHYLINSVPLNKSFFEGRYGAFIMSELLTGNLYLPIISALWGYIALSASSILLAIYWKVPKKTSYFVIFGLILNITPYTLSWVWYGYNTLNVFFARLFIFAGFILSDRVYGKTWKIKIAIMSIAILFINFGLSIYNAMIGTIVMVIIGRILVEMLDWKSISIGIKKCIEYNYVSYINAAIAIVFYQIIILYMKHINIIKGHYNMETTPLAEVPGKIILCIKSALQQFTYFSMPFYPDTLTKLFFILAVIFIVQIILSQKSGIIKVFICTTFILSLFLTKIVALMAQFGVMYLVRIEFCGYVLFNTLIIALCLKIGGILQNIKILIIGCIIYLFAINDVYMQRTWKMGFDSEILMYNRMQARLESNPNFNPMSKYNVLQIGTTIASRSKFYKNARHTYRDEVLLMTPIENPWIAWSIPSFYNGGYVKKQYWNNKFTDKEFITALGRIYNEGLLDNAKAWPAQNSIIVYEDLILVIMDETGLQKAKQFLEKQNSEEQKLKEKIKAETKPNI